MLFFSDKKSFNDNKEIRLEKMSTDDKRYVVAGYDNENAKQPKIVCSTSNLQTAKENFEKSAEKKILSTILYDYKTDNVLNIAIQGPPIYLVKAIKFSRAIEWAGDVIINPVMKRAAKIAAGEAIRKIVAALAGEPIPGVGGVIVAHFLGPYYAMKGDGVGAVKAAGGLWGGLSGAVIGGIVGGPIGAVVGGIAGGVVAGEGAGAIVKAALPPSKKTCKNCKGAGLVADYRKCPECQGYGYV